MSPFTLYVTGRTSSLASNQRGEPLAALEERTAELKASLDRIEGKLEAILDRVAKVETKYEELNQRDLPVHAPRTESEATRDPLIAGILKVSSEE